MLQNRRSTVVETRSCHTAKVWPKNSWESPQGRPRLLRLLAAGVLAASFLESYTVSDIQFLRTPAGVIAALLVIGFVLNRLRRWKIDSGTAYVAILFLTITSMIQYFHFTYGTNNFRSVLGYLQYVQVIVLFLIFLDLARDPRMIRNIGLGFICSTILMSLVANFEIEALVYRSSNSRIGVGGMNLNAQSFLYALSIIGIMGWTLERWPRLRWFDVVMIVGAYSMMLADLKVASRGGIIALVVGVLCVLVLFFRESRLWAYAFIVPLLIISLLSLWPRADVLWQRFEATVYEGDTGLRVELSAGAMEMIVDHPLIGRGSSYAIALGEHMGKSVAIAAHSTPNQILLSFGILGFAPWLILVAMIARIAWRNRSNPWGGILFSQFASTLALSFFANFAYNQYVWILLALVSRAGTFADMPLYSPSRRSVKTVPRFRSAMLVIPSSISRSNGILRP